VVRKSKARELVFVVLAPSRTCEIPSGRGFGDLSEVKVFLGTYENLKLYDVTACHLYNDGGGYIQIGERDCEDMRERTLQGRYVGFSDDGTGHYEHKGTVLFKLTE